MERGHLIVAGVLALLLVAIVGGLAWYAGSASREPHEVSARRRDDPTAPVRTRGLQEGEAEGRGETPGRPEGPGRTLSQELLGADPFEEALGEVRDDEWASAEEQVLGERLSKLTSSYRGRAQIELQCRSTCCTLEMKGEAADALAAEVASSAGFQGWFTRQAHRTRDGDDGEIFERVLCFQPGEIGAPVGVVDRLADREALMQKTSVPLEKCRGLPGAPGNLHLVLMIGADGQVSHVERNGPLQGTMAGACVEDTVMSLAHFAPATKPSGLYLTFWVEPAKK